MPFYSSDMPRFSARFHYITAIIDASRAPNIAERFPRTPPCQLMDDAHARALCHGEHFRGDTMMMARYTPMLTRVDIESL